MIQKLEYNIFTCVNWTNLWNYNGVVTEKKANMCNILSHRRPLRLFFPRATFIYQVTSIKSTVE